MSRVEPGASSSTTPGPLEGFGKLDVIALGETQSEAEAALEEDLPRILGLS